MFHLDNFFVIVYLIRKSGGNENASKLYQRNGKLTLPQRKQDNHPVIPIYVVGVRCVNRDYRKDNVRR